MTDLRLFLLSLFLFFTLICLLLCIEAHLHYHNRVGIDQDESFSKLYEYFGQPVYNQDNAIIGYELLLREFDQLHQRWQLPNNVIDYPLSKIVSTIDKIDPQTLRSIQTLALNMTVSQLLDFRAAYFFRWILATIYQKKLVVEIDAANILQTNFVRRWYLLHLLKKLDHQKVKIVIENVDSTHRTYRILRPFLPFIDYLKFNVHTFYKSKNHWIDITLAQWQQRAQDHHVTTIVGKVEDYDQVALVDQLGITLRQGYAYGRPELLNRSVPK